MPADDEAKKGWDAELERLIEGAPFVREEPDGIPTHVTVGHIPDHWPDELKRPFTVMRRALQRGRCEECDVSFSWEDDGDFLHREDCSGSPDHVWAIARRLGINIKEAFTPRS